MMVNCIYTLFCIYPKGFSPLRCRTAIITHVFIWSVFLYVKDSKLLSTQKTFSRILKKGKLNLKLITFLKQVTAITLYSSQILPIRRETLNNCKLSPWSKRLSNVHRMERHTNSRSSSEVKHCLFELGLINIKVNLLLFGDVNQQKNFCCCTQIYRRIM